MAKRKKNKGKRNSRKAKLKTSRTTATVDSQVTEAFQRGYQEGASDNYMDGGEDEPITGTTRKYGYRRTTRGLRDFTQIDRERILEIVWTLYQSNPVAVRAMEIKRDYILGRGITYQARDEALQEILDDFWTVNKMDRRLKEFTLQLYLFGVQMFTVFIRNSDGRVRMGYIDPAEIEDIIPHPENAMEMWAVLVKSQTADEQWQQHIPQRVYRIVRQEENFQEKYAEWLKNWKEGQVRQLEAQASVPAEYAVTTALTGATEYSLGPKVAGDVYGEPVQQLDQYTRDQQQDGEGAGSDDSEVDTEGKLVTAGQAKLEEWEDVMLKAMGLTEYSGSCIYVKVNSVSNQPHGYSDLLQVSDWLDLQDETLFALGDREQWGNYFSWDVTLKGAQEDTVKKRAAEIQNKAPKRGTVNLHNEAEEWVMNYPSLQQSGSIETARAIQNHAFGGLGFPEAWFGRGDETNRATLSAQGDPTWRTLEHDQDTIRDMILDILYLVRDQAEMAGTWTPEMEEEQEGFKAQMGGYVPDGADYGISDHGIRRSSNGRSDRDVRGLEVGVPDIGSKMTGKIVQDELDEDDPELTGVPEPDEEIDLEDVEDIDPYEITVIMPEMTARDLSLIAGMLSTIASALVVAEEQGWQDKAQSVETWAKALSEFGIDLDVAAIQQAIDQKQKEQELNQEQDPMGGSAVGRHGVMLDGDEEDQELDFETMSVESRESLMEAFLSAVGVEYAPGSVGEVLKVLEVEGWWGKVAPRQIAGS